jgi:hypothetical protein
MLIDPALEDPAVSHRNLPLPNMLEPETQYRGVYEAHCKPVCPLDDMGTSFASQNG